MDKTNVALMNETMMYESYSSSDRFLIVQTEFEDFSFANSNFLRRSPVNLESTEVSMNRLIDTSGTLDGYIVQKHARPGSDCLSLSFSTISVSRTM